MKQGIKTVSLAAVAVLCTTAFKTVSAGASPTRGTIPRRSAKTTAQRKAHRHDTVMYYVTGDARSADVSYTDSRGVTVHAGWVRFPWKIYLHPKKGAKLFVSASVAGAEPGATVGIWVNDQVIASGVSDGDPRGYTEATVTFGEGNTELEHLSGGDSVETTQYLGQFPLRP